MKILWIASWYPNKITELNGDFIQRQANAIDCHLSEIIVLHVCSVDNVDDYELVINKNESINPIIEIIVYYPNCKSWKKPFKLFNFFKANKVGIEYLKKINWYPELIHLHVIYPSYLVYLRFFKNLPYIISEHYGAYRLKNVFKNRPFFKLVSQMATPTAKYIFSLNESMTIAMKNQGMYGCYQQLPNVVNTTLFNYKPKLENKLFRFIHVSNMIDQIKNVSGILRAIESTNVYRNDFEVIFVGEGLDSKKIVEFSKSLKISSNIQFLGNVKYSEVANQMQEADAFILFSNYEGLPCVLLEAMACGLPVIATETGGINEFVNNNTGYLINVKDEKALESSMNLMIENSKAFNRIEISKNVHNLCSYTSIGNQIADFYKKILHF